MLYVVNAISIQMVPQSATSFDWHGRQISEEQFKQEIIPAIESGNAVSAVGHPDTARVLGVPMNRMNVALNEGDTICVCQLTGGRLPEGATTLPDGFKFTYWIVG